MKRLVLTALLVACGDTGQEHVELPLRAQGTPARAVMLGDATLTLTRADVGFGPLYVCASEAGRAELCEVALGEFLDTVTIRALEPAPQELGTLDATTGQVRSGLFDYGISWLLTQNAARANVGAPDGHSAIIEGTVARGTEALRFRATVDVTPRMKGDLSVNGQSTRFQVLAGSSLTMLADPNAWVSSLDVDALFALDADGDGAVEIPAGSVLYESILQGMLNRAPLGFVWR